jgi:hypothetical protein
VCIATLYCLSSCSTLCRKKEHEVSFLRLLEKITNGTNVEISYTGTSILFSPGTLTGGSVQHTCPTRRSIGWYLEPILAIAPFCKKELGLTLRGVTTDGKDASADTLRTSFLPHLAIFLESPEGLELRVSRMFPWFLWRWLTRMRTFFFSLRLPNEDTHHSAEEKYTSVVLPFVLSSPASTL